MNGFETPIYFDALAWGVLVGSVLMMVGFVWVILDRREYEDPLRRRERMERDRKAREREPHAADRADDGRGEDKPPRPDGRRGRRHAA